MDHRARASCAVAPDLIDAAFANAAPHQFIGAGMKVAKEEIIGLMRAIQIFVDEDEDAEMAMYRRKAQQSLTRSRRLTGCAFRWSTTSITTSSRMR